MSTEEAEILRRWHDLAKADAQRAAMQSKADEAQRSAFAGTFGSRQIDAKRGADGVYRVLE